jgi:hypothetical protein
MIDEQTKHVSWVYTTDGWVNAQHIISANIQATGAYLLHLTDGRTTKTVRPVSWDERGPRQEPEPRQEPGKTGSRTSERVRQS